MKTKKKKIKKESNYKECDHKFKPYKYKGLDTMKCKLCHVIKVINMDFRHI